MSLIVSQLPGRHERHLLRKRNNHLFPEAERDITPKRYWRPSAWTTKNW